MRGVADGIHCLVVRAWIEMIEPRADDISRKFFQFVALFAHRAKQIDNFIRAFEGLSGYRYAAHAHTPSFTAIEWPADTPVKMMARRRRVIGLDSKNQRSDSLNADPARDVELGAGPCRADKVFSAHRAL